jgi:hypothetical protein
MMSCTKDPDAKLNYTVDFTHWLGTGETISSVVWVVEDGITKSSSPAASNTTTTATVYLEGGTLGQDYTVTCRITTSAGAIQDRSFTVLVRAT